MYVLYNESTLIIVFETFCHFSLPMSISGVCNVDRCCYSHDLDMFAINKCFLLSAFSENLALKSKSKDRCSALTVFSEII